eukprot:SAG11_NODE_1238_length_5425_cov_3.387908_7_plen_83_part_00
MRYGEAMRQARAGPLDVMNLPLNAPCTPLGCIELISRAGVQLEGSLSCLRASRRLLTRCVYLRYQNLTRSPRVLLTNPTIPL